MAALPTTLAVTTALAGALLAGPSSAASASASPSPTPSGTTTITVDTAALNRLCDDRLPQLLGRAQDRLARIQGDSSTTGSAAWIEAQADRAAAAGQDDRAERLRDRADRRRGHVDELTAAISRIAQVQDTICSQRVGA